MLSKETIRAGILGVCVGDALGVPVEFRPRASLKADPVTGMRGYGTHNQPPGTWSDDSSLTLCLLESLCDGYDPKRAARSFEKWLLEAYWTPHGQVFDVGGTTQSAIIAYGRKVDPRDAGGAGERDNGNGSLMRTLPVAFLIDSLEIEHLIPIACDVSRLTHAHPRSQLACVIYVLTAAGMTLWPRLKDIRQMVANAVIDSGIMDRPEFAAERPHFQRIVSGQIMNAHESEIRSSGYVVDTLEAALWCLATTGSYREAVLKAVNLGGDTDTVGAVTGGLAGVLYGLDSIPREWLDVLARRADIEALCDRFVASLRDGHVRVTR